MQLTGILCKDMSFSALSLVFNTKMSILENCLSANLPFRVHFYTTFESIHIYMDEETFACVAARAAAVAAVADKRAAKRGLECVHFSCSYFPPFSDFLSLYTHIYLCMSVCVCVLCRSALLSSTSSKQLDLFCERRSPVVPGPPLA